MRVHLTFDIEIWCNGWKQLDQNFPGSFERYVYGRSAHGEYALPQTLAMLNRHGLRGVFFVEPLFSARFGPQPLRTIVQLIRGAGQEVQLHLHPEWTNEALQPLIENCSAKRQHLSHYTVHEQTVLIGHGRRMLEGAGSGPITTLTADSFAANRDTFAALARKGIRWDNSLNRCFAINGPVLQSELAAAQPFVVDGVNNVQVTMIRDAWVVTGRQRWAPAAPPVQGRPGQNGSWSGGSRSCARSLRRSASASKSADSGVGRRIPRRGAIARTGGSAR